MLAARGILVSHEINPSPLQPERQPRLNRVKPFASSIVLEASPTALLGGLVACGVCGRRMCVTYNGIVKLTS